jgi:UDP-GlcNAc:undecaprenyl-phosphate GlcNAc-1-phosphate transferase
VNAAGYIGIFVASLATALAVVASAPRHARWTADHGGSGIQKHHTGAPSRIGLVPIAAACLLALWLQGTQPALPSGDPLAMLLLCAAPAALIGLLEDVMRDVRARFRLIGPAVGALMGILALDTAIPSFGVPALDGLLQHWPVALAFTLLMVVGFTQAMNIVDGLNGLASGLGLMMLLATAVAAYRVDDAMVLHLALVVAAATVGFMALNFPRGLLFLGDGGAYFLGFVLAQLWILLLVRNSGEVSPWFVMAVAAHPTIETIFSIVRRRLLARRRANATAPDRQHLHTLMYRRCTRLRGSADPRASGSWGANAAASAMLLAAAAVPMALACLRPDSALWNLALLVFSVFAYLVQFRRLVRFRGPWPLTRSGPRTDPELPEKFVETRA